MKLINNWCSKLAVSLNLTEEQRDVIIFGAESAISVLYSFLLTLLVSWVFGVADIMLMVYASFAIMKSFAGGAHCKTMTNCAIFSAISFTGSAKLVELFPDFFTFYGKLILLFTFVLSLVLYILWAPGQVLEKPISKEYGKILRKRTFISLVFLTLILGLIHLLHPPFAYPLVGASCIGIVMQSLAITPLGYKLMDNIDFILTRILQRR